VLEVLRGEKTLAEIAMEFGIHPNQIVTWKKQVLAILPEVLSRKVNTSAKQQEELQNELFKQIGELKVQNEFLKKNLAKLPSLSRKNGT
jgi:transposase-like protein